MVGPDSNDKGGISASINLLHHHLSIRNLKVKLLSTTTSENGTLNKALIFFKALCKFICMMLFKRPDLVHLHMASRGSFLRKSIISLFCVFFRVPYVIHLHGGGFKEFYHGRSKLGGAYIRYVFRKSACVITLSNIWREWVLNDLHVKNVVVVPNGVPDLCLQPSEINRSRPTVLFLGLLGQNKGTDILIDAMRLVNHHIPDAVLELCGNGDIEYYRDRAKDNRNVKFLGWVDAEQRRAALGRASVFCLPSWKEGLPFSILEAMSAALPVISTEVGSIPEVVLDGVNGFLIQAGDVDGLSKAILEILIHPDTSVAMGGAGKKIQENKYSISAMVSGCIKVYQSVLGDKF